MVNRKGGRLEVRRGRLIKQIADVHGLQVGNQLELEVTLAVQANVEGLDIYFGADGSASMRASGAYGVEGGLFGFGGQPNQVEQALHAIVPALAELDANHTCHVFYWTCGDIDAYRRDPGNWAKTIEVIGDIGTDHAGSFPVPGPRKDGDGTDMVPALRHVVRTVRERIKAGDFIKAVLLPLFTDGIIHDTEQAIRYIHDELAPAIERGDFPQTVIIMIGVGKEVDEEQLEEFSHEATPEGFSGREICCYGRVSQFTELPQITAHLVAANTPAGAGGAKILDDRGNVVRVYEDVIPTVVEFNLPLTARSFTVVSTKTGTKFTQPIEIVVEEHDED